MKRIALAVAGTAAIAAAAHGSGAAGATHPDCRPPGARTEAFNSKLKVYTVRGHHSNRPGGGLFVCRRPTGKRTFVIGGPEVTWFKPPAISLRRRVVAVAVKIADPTGPTRTEVLVYDFARQIRYPDQDPTYQTRVVEVGLNSDVGSVVVNDTSGVAYIDCTPAGGTFEDDLAPGPQCKTGRVRSFVMISGDGMDKPKIVDRGRKIDPLSLRRDGTNVTWLKNGERKSADLPTLARAGAP